MIGSTSQRAVNEQEVGIFSGIHFKKIILQTFPRATSEIGAAKCHRLGLAALLESIA
jgi:hypothetical protein